MGWDVGAPGCGSCSTPRCPTIVGRYLGEDVDGFLADHGLTRADIEWWVCHPGGPKVLDALRGRPRAAPRRPSQLTWDSLARIGNLSSASVLHVLADTLRDRPPRPGSYGLLMAMGPGFCSELVLLRAAADGPTRDRADRSFTSLVALVGARAARRAGRLAAQRRVEPGAAAASRPGSGHYPVMVVLHTGLLVGDAGRGLVAPAGRARRARLVDARARRWPPRRCAGGASPPSGRAGTPASSSCPGLPPVRSRPLPPPVATPTTSRSSSRASRCRWCTRAWITAARLHRRQRRPAHRAAAGRERRAAPRPGARPMRDLLVAGGGPVGLATALYAARAGLDVVVREPRAGVIDKACGEGLMPGAGRRPGRARRRARRARRSPASATSTARRRPRRRSATGPAAACAARRCTPRCATAPRAAGVAVEHAAGARRSSTTATTWSSTASRPATWSPPTACTRRCGGCSGSTAARAPAPPLRPALPRRRSRRGRATSRCTGRRPARPT